jgi:hypothetical protein
VWRYRSSLTRKRMFRADRGTTEYGLRIVINYIPTVHGGCRRSTRNDVNGC